MRDPVRRVGMALTALLGVGFGVPACGGTAGYEAGGSDAGRDAHASGPDGGADVVNTCDAGPPPVFQLADACGKDTPQVVGGADTGYATCADGVLHRPSVTACPNLLVEAKAGECTNSGSGCTSNSDCTGMGPHSTCTTDPSPGYCNCTSGCITDSDCAKGEICECGTEIGTCVPARCTVDSDCGAGLLCAMSETGASTTCGSNGETFACQTPKDRCLSNNDCGEGSCGTTNPSCVVESSGERVCSPGCMLGLGRPFLVDAHARMAPAVQSSGWGRGARPATDTLTERERAKLADAWTLIGRMEHASVAAFARFALELVALGAPAGLLRWSQRAMSEEIDHAERAFALASAYGRRPVGPGPLDVGGALCSPTVKSVLETLIREGCIGETLAAVEAAAALERAVDPAVRATLEVVVRDETSHAALAWSAVRWLLEQHGDDLRAWVMTEVSSAIRERTDDSHEAVDPDASTLARHGILGAELISELRRAALAELVVPSAAAILGPNPRQRSAICAPQVRSAMGTT